MSTGKFGSLVLRFAIVSGIAISLTQCSKQEVVKPTVAPMVNPKSFKCTGSREVHIKTQADAPGVSPEFVILCQNDTVMWDKDDTVDSFVVTFNKSESPISGDDGKPKLTFSDKSNDSKGKARDVGLQSNQYAFYPYSIDVVDDTTHTHHPYDPGVIIVK